MNKKKYFVLGINLFMIVLGLILLLNYKNEFIRNTYIIGVLVSLLFVVFMERESLLRPMSYLIISFVIFMWARPLLSVFRETTIISAGNGRNNSNIIETIVFLGFIQNLIVILTILIEPTYNKVINSINKERKLKIGKDIELLLLCFSSLFLLLFLVDSLFKIPVIMQNDYLEISESILLEGYVFFRIGKMSVLIWVIFGTKENRFEIATTILLIASLGYLVRGARGYFISYFFLWLLFYAKNHKVRLIPLCLIALALILIANFILYYRMGWSSTFSIYESVTSTLYSQGSSIETVFGTMHFTDEIAELFPKAELLFRYDFGIFIDQARGVTFAKGGFGDSFFAELYFLGLPFGIFFLVAISFFTGLLEKAYFFAKNKCDFKNNYNLLIFMTIPNLIYFARGDIKDFIFKSLISLIFIIILTNFKKKTTEISIQGFLTKIK